MRLDINQLYFIDFVHKKLRGTSQKSIPKKCGEFVSVCKQAQRNGRNCTFNL